MITILFDTHKCKFIKAIVHLANTFFVQRGVPHSMLWMTALSKYIPCCWAQGKTEERGKERVVLSLPGTYTTQKKPLPNRSAFDWNTSIWKDKINRTEKCWGRLWKASTNTENSMGLQELCFLMSEGECYMTSCVTQKIGRKLSSYHETVTNASLSA